MIKVLNSSNNLSTWYLDPGVPADGNGTSFNNPLVWQLHSSNDNKNFNYTTPTYGNYIYVLLKLTSGTTYNGNIVAKTGPITYQLYDNDDPNTVLKSFYYYDNSTFSFSVDKTGLYIFKCGEEFDTSGSTETLTLNPSPDIIPGEESWKKSKIELSKGLDDIGYLFNYQDLVDSDLLHKTIPTDGLVFYASLKEDSTKPEIGNSWTSKSSNITYQEVDGILCATFNTGSLRTSCSQDFGTNKVTLSSWFKKIENSGTTAPFLVYGQDSVYRVAGLEESYGYFALERGSGRWTTSFAMDESWHHYACTIDDTVIKLYVDGVNVYETTQSMNLSLDTLAIGSWIAGNYNVKGYIAGCRVYNRPLLDKEIISLSKEFKI